MILKVAKFEEELQEKLADYKNWMNGIKYLPDYDEDEFAYKSQFIAMWESAKNNLEEWEYNLLLYDTYSDASAKDKREALNLKKSSYSKYLNNIRRKIKIGLGLEIRKLNWLH